MAHQIDTAGEFRSVQNIDDRAFDGGHTDRHPLPIHGQGQVVGLAGRRERLRWSDEAAGAKWQLHAFGPSGADEMNLVELGIGYAMQLKRDKQVSMTPPQRIF